MGRYTGPKGRINRRLNAQVFESAGAIRTMEKREGQPPGMHTRRRKVSNYGLALAEKQKIKYYYGIRERQLMLYFNAARRLKGNTGEQLLILCERRLDNVVRRAGFVLTRPQARQGIVHRHFQVNGKTVDRPSIRVRAGDVITLRNRPNLKKYYGAIQESITLPQASWLSFEPDQLRATVTSLLGFDEVSLPVDINQVVAFLSR
ncbi:MAG: 30S ribosomal protein S4 [Planctomycetota bacterium]|nr:30S ribosomal protein S4 [Planctomycetota bacterium]